MDDTKATELEEKRGKYLAQRAFVELSCSQLSVSTCVNMCYIHAIFL